jgi:hypothetical protein
VYSVFIYVGMGLYALLLNQREAKRNADGVHHLPPDAYSATELRTMRSWHGAQPREVPQRSDNLQWTAPTERRSRGGWGPKPATSDANLTTGSNPAPPRMRNERDSGLEERAAGQAQAQAGENRTDRESAGAVESSKENDLENPFRDPEVVESNRKRDHQVENGGK